MSRDNKTTLFFTCVNRKFWGFGMLYPMFVLLSNPGSLVEIGIEGDFWQFRRHYKHILEFYDSSFPGRVKFRAVNGWRLGITGGYQIVPNTLRFVIQPELKADYVYIGDADIFVTEEITPQHVENMRKNNLDFSNAVRAGKRRLTGLHFMEYDKMYPLPSLRGLRLGKKNDEEVLYELMNRKGYKMPDSSLTFRPAHGLHISMFSSAPFEYLQGADKLIDFPAWFMDVDSPHNLGKQNMLPDIERYFTLRKAPEFKAFTEIMTNKHDVEMRRILQITDACAYYYREIIHPLAAKAEKNRDKLCVK